MDSGDILYSNVFGNPLFAMVVRGDGQYFDFVAGAFAPVVKPFDKARFCLKMQPDATFPTKQKCIIPVAARQDPQAEMIEATVPNNGQPQPTQAYWIAMAAGVPMNLARGATLVFTG